MSALPNFTMKELLEAGVHYGHKTMRWNPKMAPYLFGSRNGTHIIDLQQTTPMLHKALQVVYDVVKKNGRVLFVGTKRQASDEIAEAAKRCGQYYVNHRWLGGMLTNWKTISKSIKTLRDVEAILENEDARGSVTKKELLNMERQAEKLRRSLGGIMDMGGKPDLLFIIDTNRESLAIAEAKILGVPVVAVVDSNSNPDGADYLIPGNDDAIRSISLYCKLISDAALAGIQDSLVNTGVDIGAMDVMPIDASKARAKAKAENDNAKAKKTPVKKVDAKAEVKKVEPKKEAAKKPETKAEVKKIEPKKEAAKKDDAKSEAKKAEPKKAAAKKGEEEPKKTGTK